MIYWISGENQTHKYELGRKFSEFLKTEKRNWRRTVFFITDCSLLKSEVNSITQATIISSFIQKSDNDTIVAISESKLPIGFVNDNIVEIIITKGKCDNQNEKNIYLDSSHTSIRTLFLTLITKLRDLEKI